MFAGTAAGELLPGFVVHRGKSLMENWVRDAPSNYGFAASESGWFNSKTFTMWFKHSILPWATHPSRINEQKAIIGLFIFFMMGIFFSFIAS